MLVFSNRRLGPSVEIVVPSEVGAAMLQQVADAIRTRAEGRWEQELLRWLDERALAAARAREACGGAGLGEARSGSRAERGESAGRTSATSATSATNVTNVTNVTNATSAIDVSEIAWTRDHFDSQRWFLADAVARATMYSDHAAALERWRRMIEAHPRDSVQFGRRWNWQATV